MKKSFGYKNIIFVFIILLIITGCKQNGEKESADNTTVARSEFMTAETSLPDAPGADAFKMNCVTCHSARYVQMQPELSRKTWEKIVDKMVTAYGAPVSDSLAKNIVDYLVTIRGKK